MISMNWENIIVQFAAIIYSEVLLSLRQLVAGQVSSKQIKMAFLTREILLTEWKE